MGRIFIILCAVLVSAFFIIKAYFFGLNGQTTIDFFEKLPLFFSASKYTFIIWFFIIGSLLYWIYMNIKVRNSNLFVTTLQMFLFVLSALLHVVSLFYWHEDELYFSILSVSVQMLVLFILYLTFPISKDYLKLRAPISIYFSWVTFEFFVKISYILVYIEWDGFGLSNALWAVIFMTIGVLVCLHLRYHHFDIAFPLVYVWGYFGIVLKNGFNELFVTAAALFLIGVMIVCTIYLKKNPAKLRA